MIKGVKTKELKVIPDERGWLMEIMRCDDDIFKKFGQVYLTTGYPGVVKAWHYHKVQTDNHTCIRGMMKVALYDARDNSPTYREINEFFMVEAVGKFRNHIISFATSHGKNWAITIAPRFLTTLIDQGECPLGPATWYDTRILLPEGAPLLWKNVITDQVIKSDGKPFVGEILKHFPVALLLGEENE